MTGFKVILDDLGIETRSANLVGKSRIIFCDERDKVRDLGAVGIQPISVESTTSGTLKGAAWGLILAGPIGVAVGSMVGGGMKVAFELQTLEGPILKGVAGKTAYLTIKQQVETRPAKPKIAKTKKLPETGPRKVGWPLMIGLAVLPILFFWLLLRPRHTDRARALGVAWLIVWSIGLANLPEAPEARHQLPSVAAGSPGKEG